MKRMVLGMMALALLSGGPGQAKLIAGQIPVTNFSFEEPSFGLGGFSIGSPPGWTATGIAGVYNPGIPVPDGVQTGYAGGYSLQTASLFQDVGVSVTPGTPYQLDVFVGTRVGFASSWTVELLAGSSVLASASGGVANGSDTFSNVELKAVGAGSGDLGIQLSQSAGGQTFFDDVRLQSNQASSVPEPSTLALVGLGIAGMAGYGWRRRKRTTIAVC